ncbi:MAG: hypothetical protein Q8Q14_01110 [Gemmatimonadales bacterium]|nr:hypothetical protein [Gemmatimonadales bacterium]
MQVSQIVRALPVLLCCARETAAQTPLTYRVATENVWFHQEPGGRRLARLVRGAVLAGGDTRGPWVQVTLDGWIFAASVGAPVPGTPGADFDLIVTRASQENLRASAGGAIIARLAQGFGLRRVAGDTTRASRWIHVRRTGWVNRAALAAVTDSSPPAAPPPASPPARAPRPMTVYRAPDGPEAGTLGPDTPVRVLSRSGEWARVQFEGWVKADEIQTAPAGVLLGVSAAELRTDPQRYAGQVLRWRVQYIALQKADDLRPDIPAGATYVLARGPLPERGFVYIIVPELKLPAVRALAPLATVQVTARVRAGRSRYLGNPVVELITLEGGAAP